MKLPLLMLHCLFELARVCHPDVSCEVEIQATEPCLAEWEKTDFELTQVGHHWHLRKGGLENVRRLGAALRYGQVPKGTQLLLRTHHAECVAACQSFAGSLQGEDLVLPDDPALQRALAIFQAAHQEQPIPAGSASLALEVAERGNLVLQVEGHLLSCKDPSWLPEVARLVCLLDPQLQARWDYREALAQLAQEEAESAQRSASLQQVLSQLGRSLGVSGGAVVWQGKYAKYCHGQLTDLEPIEAADVDDIDAEMLSLGFSPVGTLMAAEIAGSVVRGYVCEQRDAFGAVLSGPSGQFVREFYSWLEDGGSLTTSTLIVAEDIPAGRIWRNFYATIDLGFLLARHRERLQSLGKPRSHSDLLGLAQSIDDYMVRYRRHAGLG
jgi:hypothetical protein